MALITMSLIHSLVKQLQHDFPALQFKSGTDFQWSPENNTVIFDPQSVEVAFLLHELAHAVLNHRRYSRDIELIEIERAAWEYTKNQLGPQYKTDIHDEVIESSLDTYRDWLHARSTCPHCQATGMQVKQTKYRCVACQGEWRVNEARQCGLKRYKLTN